MYYAVYRFGPRWETQFKKTTLVSYHVSSPRCRGMDDVVMPIEVTIPSNPPPTTNEVAEVAKWIETENPSLTAIEQYKRLPSSK